ncbi:heavy metal RND transporter, partial [Escherichia coli]|nr:heavy metal RND transporter [Escherichia coli]
EEQAKKLVSEGQRQLPLQNASVANGSAPSGAIDAKLTLAAMQDRVTDASRDVQVAQARLMQLTGESDVRTAGSLPR